MCDQSNHDDEELSASDESDAEEPPGDAPFDPELDRSEDEEECAPNPPTPPQSSFALSGTSSAFSNRSNNIFQGLDSPLGPPPPKKRGVPDYMLHPERWTRYSLEDVPETTESSNRTAARDFLSGQQKVVFSRPQRAVSVSEEGAAGECVSLSHLAEEEGEQGDGGRKRKEAKDRTERTSEDWKPVFRKPKIKTYRKSSGREDQ